MVETFSQQPWLSLLTFAPLIGAICIALRRLIARKDEKGVIVPGENEQI